MKKLLLYFLVLSCLLSCDYKPKGDLGKFEITETLEDISSVTYIWNWSSSGYTDIAVEFEFDEDQPPTFNGEAIAYSLINTRRLSDVYTYKDGKPDFDSTYRAWVVTYNGSVARRVNVDWSGTLVQTKGQGRTFVEVLFQVYGDGERQSVGDGNWPPYSNNIRPQIGVDTLFLGLNMTEQEINSEREAARARMIAPFHSRSVNLAPVPPNNNEEEDEEDEGEEEEEEDDAIEYLEMDGSGVFDLLPGITYRMQLFIRVFNNDRDRNAEYEITDGRLNIRFD